MATKTEAAPVIYIRPARGWIPLNLSQLWAYRELVYFLTWRDVKVRYKQASLGIGWAILQPVMSMVIFTVIFNKLLGVTPDAGIPENLYPIFAFAALLPWQLFQGALQRSSISLVANSNLLTKIYFPRLIIPMSAVTAGLVDFFFSFVVLLGLMVFYKVEFTAKMVFLIPLLILALAAALSVGLWFSAMNVQYRDVQQMVPFIITAWMYASPVVFSIDKIPEGPWRLLYSLNPMVGVIQGFRWVLLGATPPGGMVYVSALIVAMILISGLYYFRRMERNFADLV